MIGFSIVIGFAIGAIGPWCILRLVLDHPRTRQRAWEYVYRNYPVDLTTGKVRR